MERLKSIFDWDSYKVAAVAIATMSLNDIDVLIRILVGLASLAYILSKLWKLWTRKQHGKKD